MLFPLVVHHVCRLRHLRLELRCQGPDEVVRLIEIDVRVSDLAGTKEDGAVAPELVVLGTVAIANS